MAITTIAFVGQKGGLMANLADYALCVPGETSAHIQEMHIACGHIICGIVENYLFGENIQK